MIFRCSACLSLSALNLEALASPIAVKCDKCSTRFRSQPTFPGRGVNEYHKLAARLSTSERLDLGSAYAVLCGAMTLDRARILRTRAAVRDREAARSAPPKPPYKKRFSTTTLSWMVSLTTSAVLLAAFGWVSVQRRVEPPVVRNRVPRDVDIVRAADGSVVRVSGPDPRAVLVGYCASLAGSARCVEPEIARLGPGERRLGLFRRPDEEGLWAVEIVHEEGVQHWAVGDGTARLEASLAPDFPEGTPRFPAEWH